MFIIDDHYVYYRLPPCLSLITISITAMFFIDYSHVYHCLASCLLLVAVMFVIDYRHVYHRRPSCLLSTTVMLILDYYHAYHIFESILTFNIVTFYGHVTVKQKNRLNKIVNIVTKLINLNRRTLMIFTSKPLVKKQKYYK